MTPPDEPDPFASAQGGERDPDELADLHDQQALDDLYDTGPTAAGTAEAPPPAPADPPAERAEDPAAVTAAGPADPPAEPEAAAAGKPARRAGKKPRRKAPWWELPLLVAIAVGVAVLVKTFVIQPFYIPSQSMEKTLHGCPGCSGDRILVFKPVYDVRDPHPGDIVVFDAPPGWNEGPPPTSSGNVIVRAFRSVGQFIGFVPPDDLVLVKRVIAVGGQTVRGYADPGGQDVVQISDHGADGPWRTLSEPFVYQDGPDPRATFGPVTVPKGRLWVMGDHRNDSADSRFHCGSGGDGGTATACDPTSSTVPVSEVIGKAVVIAWPPSCWRTLGTPATFTSAALPAVGGAAAVLPLWLIRRRRRRGRRRDGAAPAAR